MQVATATRDAIGGRTAAPMAPAARAAMAAILAPAKAVARTAGLLPAMTADLPEAKIVARRAAVRVRTAATTAGRLDRTTHVRTGATTAVHRGMAIHVRPVGTTGVPRAAIAHTEGTTGAVPETASDRRPVTVDRRAVGPSAELAATVIAVPVSAVADDPTRGVTHARRAIVLTDRTVSGLRVPHATGDRSATAIVRPGTVSTVPAARRNAAPTGVDRSTAVPGPSARAIGRVVMVRPIVDPTEHAPIGAVPPIARAAGHRPAAGATPSGEDGPTGATRPTGARDPRRTAADGRSAEDTPTAAVVPIGDRRIAVVRAVSGAMTVSSGN